MIQPCVYGRWINPVTGYAYNWIDGRMVSEHKYAYEQRYGPVPLDMDLDHLCRNRACKEPTHLEVVTRSENLRRGELHGRGVCSLYCPRGHRKRASKCQECKKEMNAYHNKRRTPEYRAVHG